MARKLTPTASGILKHLLTYPDSAHTRKSLAHRFDKIAYSTLASLKKKKLVRISKDGLVTLPDCHNSSSVDMPKTVATAEELGCDVQLTTVNDTASNAMAALADLIAENHRLNQIINQLKKALSND